MSLSAGQVPGEASTARGQEGSTCPKSHLSPTFSPYPAPRIESPVGAAARSILRVPEPSASRPLVSPGAAPRCPLAEAQVPSSGTRGPEGQTGIPSSPAASLALPTAPAPPSQPLSPLLHRNPLCHRPTAPVSPALCSLLPRSPPRFFSPLSHVPPFPHILPFLHAGSGLWPPPLGLSHRAPGTH